MQALGKDGRKKRYQDYSEGQWGYAGATILGDCLVFFHLLDEWLVTRLSPPSKWVARVRLDFLLEVWIEANLPTEHLGYKFDSAPSTSKGESVFLPWKPPLLNHLQSFSDILGKHILWQPGMSCAWLKLPGSATVPGPGIPVDPTTTRLPLWPSGLKSDVAPLGKCREWPFCDASWDKCAPKNRDEICHRVAEGLSAHLLQVMVLPPVYWVPGLAIHSISPSVIDLWFSIGSVSRLGRIQILSATSHPTAKLLDLGLRFLMLFAISTMVWSSVQGFPMWLWNTGVTSTAKPFGCEVLLPALWLLLFAIRMVNDSLASKRPMLQQKCCLMSEAEKKTEFQNSKLRGRIWNDLYQGSHLGSSFWVLTHLEWSVAPVM